MEISKKKDVQKEQKQSRNLRIALLVLFVTFIASVYIPEALKEPDSEDVQIYKAHSITALVCAENEVKDSLKSPSTAKFEGGSSDNKTGLISYDDSKYTFIVRSYVDSQNSFGATVRSEFECTVHIKPDGSRCTALCNYK